MTLLQLTADGHNGPRGPNADVPAPLWQRDKKELVLVTTLFPATAAINVRESAFRELKTAKRALKVTILFKNPSN